MPACNCFRTSLPLLWLLQENERLELEAKLLAAHKAKALDLAKALQEENRRVKDVADAKYAEVDAKTKVRSEAPSRAAGRPGETGVPRRGSGGLSACQRRRALWRCPCRLTKGGLLSAVSSSPTDPACPHRVPVSLWPCHFARCPTYLSACRPASPPTSLLPCPASLTPLQSVSADVLSKIDAWKVESEAVAGENARLREGVLALQRTLEATAAKHEAELRTRDIEVKVRPPVGRSVRPSRCMCPLYCTCWCCLLLADQSSRCPLVPACACGAAMCDSQSLCMRAAVSPFVPLPAVVLCYRPSVAPSSFPTTRVTPTHPPPLSPSLSQLAEAKERQALAMGQEARAAFDKAQGMLEGALKREAAAKADAAATAAAFAGVRTDVDKHIAQFDGYRKEAEKVRAGERERELLRVGVTRGCGCGACRCWLERELLTNEQGFEQLRLRNHRVSQRSLAITSHIPLP
jgi:hypothetical protein